MKNTKRALFLSVVSMFLCVVMLAGTTFAWFTDSVESTGNIIASGTLKVEMTYSDALNGTYADASTGKIFNYNLWEPGYTDVKYVKIENVGNLAFKYMLSIVPEGEASILANVIDVYFATTEGSFTAPTRSSMGSLVKVGTLADMIAEADGAAHGELSAAAGNNSVTACIALKMQESAGNEYQNLTIGNTGFSVKLVATQLTYENDSFDDQYDAGADYDGEISSYESLVAALANGGTYKVVKDIATENTITVPAGKTVTLDLGGKTISSTVTAIENNGTLTVANGTIDVSASTSQATRVIKNNGTLILEGGSYKGTTALYSYAIWNAGTLTANGANVVGGFGGLSVNTGAKAEVNGGTYTVSSNAGGHTIYLQSGGELVINGGTFKGDVPNYTNAYDYLIFATAGSSVTINGGTFEKFLNAYNGDKPVAGDLTAVEIYGGTFAVSPDKYGTIAAGYKIKDNGDGTWTVGENKVENATDLKAAMSAGGSVKLGEGKIAVEDLGYVNSGEATIVGGTLSRDTASGNPLTINSTEKVTFEEVTFESVKGGAVLATRKDGANIEVNDCTFTNLSSPSTGNTGVQVYANNVTMTFNGCTFNNMPIVTNSSNPEGIKLVFNDCTFNWVGDNCPGLIHIANNLEIDVEINDSKFTYKTDSQYTTAKNLISYNWPGASTVELNNVTVEGTRNNDKIWKIASSNNKVSITTSGTCSYTFNGTAIDFATYLK